MFSVTRSFFLACLGALALASAVHAEVTITTYSDAEGFLPGDTVELFYDIENTDPDAYDAVLFLGVEVDGLFYFLPNFGDTAESFDEFLMPSGYQETRTLVVSFTAPDTPSPIVVQYFGALLDESTQEQLGELAAWTFTMYPAGTVFTPTPTSTPTETPTETPATTPTETPTPSPTKTPYADQEVCVEDRMIELLNAQWTYHSQTRLFNAPPEPDFTYAATFDELHAPGRDGASYLSFDFIDQNVCGYFIEMEMNPNGFSAGQYWSWSASAWPINYTSGQLSYYIDESGVFRADDTGGPLTEPDGIEPRFVRRDYRPEQRNEFAMTDTSIPIVAAKQEYWLNARTNNPVIREHGYAPALSNLEDIPRTFYDDDPWIYGGVSGGYTFVLEAGQEFAPGQFGTWSMSAWPLAYPYSGRQSYYLDNTGVYRREDKNGAPLDGFARFGFNPPSYRQPEAFNDPEEAPAFAAVFEILGGQQEVYAQTGGYAEDLTSLQTILTSPIGGQLNNTIYDGLSRGYTFTLQAGDPDANGAYQSFSATADSLIFDRVICGFGGKSAFYVDQSGVVRFIGGSRPGTVPSATNQSFPWE